MLQSLCENVVLFKQFMSRIGRFKMPGDLIWPINERSTTYLQGAAAA